MPFVTQPFILKLQTRLDKDATVYEKGVEGDIPAGIPIPSQLVQKPPPLPPLEWAKVWSEATAIGAAGIIPFSTTIPVAQAAMFATLLGATSAAPPHSILKAGFVAFAAAYTLGTVPGNSATSIPPSGPPAFESLDGVGNSSTTNLPWLTHCSVLLSQWFATGTAIYLPNGPTLMWM